MPELLLRTREVAERLRVRPSTIRGWAREGVIPEVRINHKVRRFSWPAVLAAIERRTARIERRPTVECGAANGIRLGPGFLPSAGQFTNEVDRG